MRAIAIVVLLAASAHAEDDTRPWHGSAGVGASFLLTGDNGDRSRFDLEVDLEPSSRYGVLLALRGFDRDHRGLACVGLVYEAAAARPLVVVDLHADLGADVDRRRPMAGGGVRTTITLVGPLGIALDTGAYLVIDGVDNTRLEISTNASIVARW